MSLNWLDICLLIIILFTFIFGIIKGFLRQIVGIIAVIAGLILAALYHPQAAIWINKVIHHEVIAFFLSFVLIFLIVLCLGWIIGMLLSKILKGPLKFINHVFGGFLGILKGVLIGGVLTFAMLVFPVDRIALENSRIAPVCLATTKLTVNLIPQDLRNQFREAYKKIIEKVDNDVNQI